MSSIYSSLERIVTPGSVRGSEQKCHVGIGSTAVRKNARSFSVERSIVSFVD